MGEERRGRKEKTPAGIARLLAFLIVGLIVGAALGSYATALNDQRQSRAASTTTLKVTIPSTISRVFVSTLTEVTTTTALPRGYYQLAQALNNSANARLNVTSYMFLNSEPKADQNFLTAEIENVGNGSILVSPQECLLNYTFFKGTFVGPEGQSVIYGQSVYAAPGWSFVVEIKLPFTPSLRDNSTLQIFNNSWTFMFGTATPA